ncbi:hypothetical protein ACLB2K_024537 [Fragaria x ananassa]
MEEGYRMLFLAPMKVNDGGAEPGLDAVFGADEPATSRSTTSQEFPIEDIEGYEPNRKLDFNKLFKEGNLINITGTTIRKQGFRGESRLFGGRNQGSKSETT